MALTPEQAQLLQQYMLKNRTPQQPGMQAQSFQAQPMQSSNTSSGVSSLLRTLGGYFDTPPMQGPVQPGASTLPQGQPSALTRFANNLDPQGAIQLQANQMQLSSPKFDPQFVAAALKRAGLF